MSKLNGKEFMDLEHGDIYTGEKLKSIQKEEISDRIRLIYRFIKDGKLENVSLEDLELIMKLEKRDKIVMIDYSKNNGSYFTVKCNKDIRKSLNKNTKSLLFDISQLMTHDNTIVTDNNKPISNFKALYEYLEVDYNLWSRHVRYDNLKYNIIKKEPINGKMYLVLNPLFAIKSRNITEYIFKCFYKELKEFLHPIDYLYLVKLHGIDPSNLYISAKHEKKSIKSS